MTDQHTDEAAVGTRKFKLFLIDWEDSAQPKSAWEFADDLTFSVIRIQSVGWLVKDGKRIKALAPNVGGVDGKVSAQVSGVIQIPTCCVISMKELNYG